MAVASLNATLEEQKRLKYDSALENELRQWMSSFLSEPELKDTTKPFHALLKDGSALCRIANKLHTNLVPRINTSTLAFKQMENITNYLAACAMLGFQPGELFDTTDLYENKDFMRVLLHINVLRKFSEKYNSEEICNLVAQTKRGQPASTSNFGSGSVSTFGAKGRSRSSVLSRSTIQQRNASSAPNSPNLTQETHPGSSSPASETSTATVLTHKRAGSAFSRPSASPLKSSDSSASTASAVSLGSPSISRAAVIEVSSLHDDVVTKEEFKYSHEVEGIAQRWIEAVLKEKFPTGVTFANALKSGVILCKLINAIKPGSVTKINTANIAYLQMENIEHYLKACAVFGLRNSDLFDTTDLFEAKNMSIVVSHIIVLGNTVKKMDTWKGPVIEDSKHAKNLWAESLNMNEINEAELEKAEAGKPIPPEQQEWIDWVNSQLAKRDWKPIKNLTVNLKSGVVLSRLLEILLGQDIVYVAEPKFLWQYINNVTMALRVLAAQTFELVPGCSAREIVNGNVNNIITLLHYLRDKFDLEFLFNKVLGEDIDDDEMDAIESETREWQVTPTWLPEPPAPPIHQAPHPTVTPHHTSQPTTPSLSSPSATSTPGIKPDQPLPSPSPATSSTSTPTAATGFIGRPKDTAYSPRHLPGVLDQSPRHQETKAEPVHPVRPVTEVQHRHAQHQVIPGPTSPGRAPVPTPSISDKKPIPSPVSPISPRQQPLPSPTGPIISPGRSTTAPAPAPHHRVPPGPLPAAPAPTDTPAKLPDTSPRAAVVQEQAKPPALEQRPLSPRRITDPVIPVSPLTTVSSSDSTGIKKVKRTRSHREKKEKKLKEVTKSLSDRDIKKQETAKRAVEKEREKEEKKEKRKEEKREKEKKKEEKEKKKKKRKEDKKERKTKHRKALSTADAMVLTEKKPESISKGTKKSVFQETKASSLTNLTQVAPAVAQPPPKHEPAAVAIPPVSPVKQPMPSALSPREMTTVGAQRPALPEAAKAVAPAAVPAAATPAVPTLNFPSRPTAGTTISDRPISPTFALPVPGQATLRRAAQAAAELKREKARNVVRKRVVDEILSTETSYVRSLEIVVEQVVAPLQTAATSHASKVLSDGEMGMVFMNISTLLAHHKRFLELIKERVTSWNPRSTIGDIFLMHTDFIREYGQYLNNYNTALVTMRHLVERRPVFKKIKEAFEVYQLKTTALTLDAFLIMPVQRIPRYVLLLKELLKYSNPSHPDYALLEKAHAKVKSILDELNRGIDEEAHVRVQKIISIEDDIEGLLEHLPDGLYKPQRRLLREGMLNLRITHRGARRKDSLRSFQKQFYFFAFTDLLVCCGRREQHEKPKAGGKAKETPEAGKSFRYAASIFFHEVEGVGDGMAAEQHDAEALQSKLLHIQFAFHIESPHVAWTLVCSSDQEKQEWMSLVKQGVAAHAKK